MSKIDDTTISRIKNGFLMTNSWKVEKKGMVDYKTEKIYFTTLPKALSHLSKNGINFKKPEFKSLSIRKEER